MTPAEQIRRFVERHPGEWQAVGSPFVHGGARDFPDGASLSTAAGYVVLMPGVRGVVVNVSRHGHDAARVGQTSGADILARIAARIADACQIYEVSADTLPPWLADPVRRQLRTRAGELLTLAGGSPADVVSAAETADEALCARPVVEVTGVLRALSAVLAALQEIGMSCRWIRNPGDTGINPEREALQDARLALSCADDAMPREQLLDLFRDLRRVLGVT